MKLKFSAPKQTTWWVAVAAGVIGILSHFGVVSLVDSSTAFLLEMAAFLILAFATTNKGL